MKVIKSIFKHCDYFGVDFNFHYKTKDKYRTATGGFIFILFLISSIIYFTINLNSFLKRKNMDIIYYKMQTKETDDINFLNYSLVNAFTIQCNNKQLSQNEFNYFSFEVHYVNITQFNGSIIKEKIPLNFSKCKKEDFYNKFNEETDIIGLNDKYCFDTNNITIRGEYTDEIYKYVEISLKMKLNDYQKYYDYLTQNDCNFQLYYTDYGFNIKNYNNPIISFLGHQFIKLNPNYSNNMDVYFIVQHFESDHNFLSFNTQLKYYVAYSKNEQYQIYKGNERFEKRINDYNILSKMFLRVDSGRYIIIRKYQKIYSFLGNLASIFSNIILILFAIVKKINSFYLYQSLMKKLFLFHDEKQNNILFKRMSKKLKEIDFSKSRIRTITKRNNNFVSSKPRSSQLIKLSIFNSPKHPNIQRKRKNTYTIIGDRISSSDKVEINKTITQLIKNKNTNQETIKKYPKKKMSIKYTILEIIIIKFFPCFVTRILHKKNFLFNKGRTGIFFYLDILNFMKSMATLEMLTYIILEPYQMKMLKFLSKPSISVASKINKVNQLKEDLKMDITEDEMRELLNHLNIIENNMKTSNIEKRLYDIINMEFEYLLMP